MPMYLTIAVVVTAVVLSIFALSAFKLISDSQIHQIETEINKIIVEAENMFEYADSGTLVTVQIEFPSSLRFAVFGDLPKANLQKPTDLQLNEDTSNNYYFIMNDGTMKTYHSHVRFCGEHTTSISVLEPGSLTLCIELVHEGENTFVKIY